MRDLIKSNNTLVLIAGSPAFKTTDETGYLFSAIQNSSYSFQMDRNSFRQVGRKKLQVNDVNRHPDVDLTINYLMSPTMYNETSLGLNFSLGKNYIPVGLLEGLSDKSYNFYFYNHPEQGYDAIEYFKSTDLSTPNGGEVISIGNAYLNNYAITFENGSIPSVTTSYKCSNIEGSLYEGLIKSPAINLQNGNSIGVGNINLENSVLSGTINGETFDRSDPSILSNSCGLDLKLENIQVGGQRLSEEEHLLQSFQFSVDLARIPLYGLGSDYVYGRKVQYPIRGNISISSKVDNYEVGFVSGLLASEEDYKFELSTRQNQYALKFLFDNVKLTSFNYSMGVNNEMTYDANFEFLAYDEKGLNAWPFSLGPSIVYDSLGIEIRSTSADIPSEWSRDDLTASSLFLGNNVVNIGAYAFEGCQNITGELGIPDSTKVIGKGAFQQCSSFDGSLFLSDNLQQIGSGAFFGCLGFDGDLYLGENISNISQQAFYNCNGFTGNLSMPEDLTNIGSEAFFNCFGFTEKIIIGQNVTIGADAFEGCNFDTLELRDSVINIQNGNFDYWSDWAINLSLPLSVKTIGDYSFDDYIFIGDLNIPKFVTSIGKGAFLNCAGFDGSLTISDSRLKVIDNSGFKNCSNFIGNLTLPNSLTGLGDSAFYGCQNLGSQLTLGTNLTKIGNSAFENCSSFVGDLTIFDFVNSVGERAFANCVGLDGKITLNYQTFIGVDAFLGCSFSTLGISDSLLSVNDGNYDEFFDFTGSLEIGSSIISIGDYAFNGYSFEGDLNITDSVKTIGVDAFSGCLGFSGPLNIGLNTTSVGDGAFEDCVNFDAELTLSQPLINIGDRAFLNCNQLTGNLIIKDNVIAVGDSSFENCSSLNGIIDIGESVASVGDKSFADCSSLNGALILPSSLESIGVKAFSNCILLNGDLDLGANTSSILDGAFSGCVGLDESLLAGKNIAFGSNVFDGCNFNNLTVKGSATTIDEGDFSFYLPFVSNSSLTLENGVEILNTGAFSGYNFTGDLNISSTVSDIKTSAFENAGFDRYLLLGNFVQNIEDRAFKNTTFIGDLDLPPLISNLGDEAFYNCFGFTGDIVLVSSLNSIGNASFYNCYGFDGILDLGSSLVTIGKSGFKDCYNLNGDIELAPSTLLVDDEAFKNCTGFNGQFILNNVTGINNESFYGCSNIVGVLDLPINLGYIGDYAFGNCSKLEVVCISNDIESGVQPFLGCDFKELCTKPVSGLISDGDYDWYKSPAYSFDTQSILTFENNLTGIGDNAFDGFGFTGGLIFPNSLISIGSGAFYNCPNFAGDLEIGLFVNYIGPDAFKDCVGFDGSLIVGNSLTVSSGSFDNTNFSNLTIKEGVTEVSDGEFDFFSGINASLTLPSTLIKINEKSFDNYSFTGSLELPAYLDLIDKSGFYGCDGFEGGLIISGSGGDYTVGDYAFYDCVGFNGALRISENVRVGNFAFGNTNFSSIEISGSGLKIDTRVEVIEFGAFEELSGAFSSIEFHEFASGDIVSSGITGITSIESNAFSNYTVLDGDLKLPCSLTGIGDYAFSGCNGYDSLEIGAGIQFNDENVFADCDFKRLVIAPCQGTIQQNDYSFYKNFGYDTQSSLSILEGITGIDGLAFKQFGFTGGLELPNSLETLGSEAFKEATGLSSLQIGTELISIGNNAFEGNTGLTSLKFSGAVGFENSFPIKLGYGLQTIGSRAFRNCNNIVDMDFLPEGVNTIGAYAFENCTGISLNTVDGYPGAKGVINIPDSVTSVGVGAFKNAQQDPNGGFLIASTGAVLSTQIFENCYFSSLLVPESVSVLGSRYDFIESLISPNGLNLFLDCYGVGPSQFKDWDLVGGLEMLNFEGCFPSAFHNAYNSPLPQDAGQLILGIGVNDMIFSESCFENCSSFSGLLDLEGPTKTIGTKAFKGCNGLQGLILPSSLQELESYAFSGCNSISSSLSFAEELLYIRDGAFENCSSIVGDLIFKDAITAIGQNGFNGCTSINNVYINRDSSILGLNAFSGPVGTLFVTNTHIASYGGAGATYDGMTVALWSTYPTV